MSKIFFDCGISLDGFFAGNNRSPKNPMGGVSGQLHQWMLKQKAFWKHIKAEGGQEYGPDSKLIEDVFPKGFLFKHPWVQKGSTTFHFINDGIHSALEKARQSANGKDIRIQGGANTIQQYLNAGLIEECFIHISPVILGSGIRLFDHINSNLYNIQIEEVIPSDLTTHLRYKLVKK